jgi:transcription antitermination factor NusG
MITKQPKKQRRSFIENIQPQKSGKGHKKIVPTADLHCGGGTFRVHGMSWMVLYLKPRCEKKFAEYCRIHGIEYYLPLRTETKIYQRRKVIVEKPVFPGYFFSCMDEEGRLTLLKTNNIVRVFVPPEEKRLLFELDQVRKALMADPTLGSCVALERGKRVRITGGAFMGVEGMVSSLKGRSKVCLNVDMIGRAVAVEVDRQFLEVL